MEQFQLPQQESLLGTYWHWMYLGINSGSIIGHLVTPLLFPIDCFGEDNCFALPFGLMAFMMIVALAILITGYFTRNYKRNKPKRNVILDTFGVLGHAVWYKIKSFGDHENPEESPENERRKAFNQKCCREDYEYNNKKVGRSGDSFFTCATI